MPGSGDGFNRPRSRIKAHAFVLTVAVCIAAFLAFMATAGGAGDGGPWQGLTAGPGSGDGGSAVTPDPNGGVADRTDGPVDGAGGTASADPTEDGGDSGDSSDPAFLYFIGSIAGTLDGPWGPGRPELYPSVTEACAGRAYEYSVLLNAGPRVIPLLCGILGGMRLDGESAVSFALGVDLVGLYRPAADGTDSEGAYRDLSSALESWNGEFRLLGADELSGLIWATLSMASSPDGVYAVSARGFEDYGGGLFYADAILIGDASSGDLMWESLPGVYEKAVLWSPESGYVAFTYVGRLEGDAVILSVPDFREVTLPKPEAYLETRRDFRPDPFFGALGWLGEGTLYVRCQWTGGDGSLHEGSYVCDVVSGAVLSEDIGRTVGGVPGL